MLTWMICRRPRHANAIKDGGRLPFIEAKRKISGAAENTSAHAADDAQDAPVRMNWARLLKRVFGIDLEHCPQCGGTLKIIAAIEEPAVIVRILTHLGLPARAPPHLPARPLALFQAA